MKDIDRNINSYLYYATSAFNRYNDVRDLDINKLKKVFTIENSITGIQEGVIGYVDIEPGEYYYRHSLYTDVSEGSCLFAVYASYRSLPIFSYYAITPIEQTYTTLIPYHFIVSTTTRIQFSHEKPSSQKFHLNSTLELFKRVA